MAVKSDVSMEKFIFKNNLLFFFKPCAIAFSSQLNFSYFLITSQWNCALLFTGGGSDD
jgi:hypothetical protein